MKKITLLLLLTGFALASKAQSELTLPFLRDVFQSTYIDPTNLPEHTVSIGIPGVSVYGQFIHNGFVPNNFLKYQQDTMRINLDNLYKDLNDGNLIYLGENLDILHIRFKVNNGFYWFGMRQNLNVSFFYPKNLFSLAIEGNEPFIDKELDLSNTKLDASLYNEYSFGMSKEIPHWVFGGRISLLQGLYNLNMDPDALSIKIDTANYDVTAKANAVIHTAGLSEIITSTGFFEPNVEVNSDRLSDFNYLSDKLTSFKNKGFALSGGVAYKLDDKTKFSFSFYNLGFITWKDSVKNYKLKGSTVYNEVSFISKYLNDKDINMDSLLNVMRKDFDTTDNRQSYRTWLNPHFNLTASYDIFRRTSVGLSFSGVFNKQFYPAVTFGLQQGIGRFFNIIGTVSANQRTIKNVGLGLVIKPGPLQIFIITDNAYPAVTPMYFTNTNIRVGINLVFGRVKPADGLPYR